MIEMLISLALSLIIAAQAPNVPLDQKVQALHVALYALSYAESHRDVPVGNSAPNTDPVQATSVVPVDVPVENKGIKPKDGVFLIGLPRGYASAPINKMTGGYTTSRIDTTGYTLVHASSTIVDALNCSFSGTQGNGTCHVEYDLPVTESEMQFSFNATEKAGTPYGAYVESELTFK